MPLSEQKLQVVFEHLKSRVKAGCPLCGDRNWTVDANLQFMGVFDPEYKQPVQEDITPLVMVTCNGCQISFHLPAMKLHLLD